jgi:hypothetical protein
VVSQLPDIHLVAPAGSGKTTIAKLLERDHGYTRRAFATGVREEVAKMLAAIPHPDPVIEAMRLYDPQTFEEWVIGQTNDPRAKVQYRGLLQWLGTDWRRAQNPDYWAQQAAAWRRHVAGPVVFDDTRFLNEIQLNGRRRGAGLPFRGRPL